MQEHIHLTCVMLTLLAGCSDGNQISAASEFPTAPPQKVAPATRLNLPAGSRIDFGEVLPGETLAFRFPVKNEGSHEVRFAESPEVGCGCTAAGLSKVTLLPGETAHLTGKITFPPISGESKAVLIRCNYSSGDDVEGSLSFSVHGFTQSSWSVIPRKLNINRAPNARKVINLRIVGSVDNPIQITEVEGNVLEDVRFTERAITFDDPGEISAFISPETPDGRYEVSIATSSTEEPQQTVSLAITTVSPFRAIPGRLFFAAGESQRTARINFLTDQSIKRIEVPGTRAELISTRQLSSERQLFIVDVTLDAEFELPGSIRAYGVRESAATEELEILVYTAP